MGRGGPRPEERIMSEADQELQQQELKRQLVADVRSFEEETGVKVRIIREYTNVVGGGPLDGATVAILLGGSIAGGIFHAAGKDIWDAVKSLFAGIVDRFKGLKHPWNYRSYAVTFIVEAELEGTQVIASITVKAESDIEKAWGELELQLLISKDQNQQLARLKAMPDIYVEIDVRGVEAPRHYT
jgi:hypothetical protein